MIPRRFGLEWLPTITLFDHEDLYRQVSRGAWSAALQVARTAAGTAGQADPQEARAMSVLAESLEAVLAAESEALSAGNLEDWILLGRTGRLPVSERTEGLLVTTLIARYRDHPERALTIARFRPDVPAAGSVIAQYGSPERETFGRIGDADGAVMDVRPEERPESTGTAGRSLLRSARERALYEAARSTWPDHLVIPNVALHAALSFERIKGRLTRSEQAFFFRGLVDLVVFDPANDFEPIHFIELDSNLHDDDRRAARDADKERILSMAGYGLLRLRPPEDGPHATDPVWYADLLRRFRTTGRGPGAGVGSDLPQDGPP